MTADDSMRVLAKCAEIFGPRRLQRFGRGGFIKLAMRTRTPIVSVAVVGAEEIHPIIHQAKFVAGSLGVPYVPVTPTFPALGPLWLLPLPTKWKIKFGSHISFERYTTAQLDDFILINRLSDNVRKNSVDAIESALETYVALELSRAAMSVRSCDRCAWRGRAPGRLFQ